jgi:hypothetical protein
MSILYRHTHEEVLILRFAKVVSPFVDIALLASTMAFCAICLWLTVRIVNRRERWAKWALAGMISLPVLYVASFGLGCRLIAREDPDAMNEHPWFDVMYWPIVRCATAGARRGMTGSAVDWCVAQVLPENSQIYIPDRLSPDAFRWRTGFGSENQYSGMNPFFLAGPDW